MPLHLRFAIALLAFAAGGLVLIGSSSKGTASASLRTNYILAFSSSAQTLLRVSDLAGLKPEMPENRLACGHVLRIGPVGVGANCRRLADR